MAVYLAHLQISIGCVRPWVSFRPRRRRALGPGGISIAPLGWAPYNSFATRAEGSRVRGATKGELETAIRNAIVRFEQEFMGRGPEDVRVFIVRDLVVIRLKGVLTPAERQLAKTSDGVEMVRRLRQALIGQGRERLFSQISEIMVARPTALFTDIDT